MQPSGAECAFPPDLRCACARPTGFSRSRLGRLALFSEGGASGAGDEEAHEGQAAHACRALCRARVAEELQRRRGTRIGEHLKLVLSIIDRQER